MVIVSFYTINPSHNTAKRKPSVTIRRISHGTQVKVPHLKMKIHVQTKCDFSAPETSSETCASFLKSVKSSTELAISLRSLFAVRSTLTTFSNLFALKDVFCLWSVRPLLGSLRPEQMHRPFSPSFALTQGIKINQFHESNNFWTRSLFRPRSRILIQTESLIKGS
jgi:hypothetical protein